MTTVDVKGLICRVTQYDTTALAMMKSD